MKAIPGAIALALLVALAACGSTGNVAPVADQTGSSDPLNQTQLAAAESTIGFQRTAKGQVQNACGDAVTPKVMRAKVGGSADPAWLVTVGSPASAPGCYSTAGGVFWLLKKDGNSFRTILNGSGSVAILGTEHGGVRDLAVGPPGATFPLYVWNGNKYKRQGMVDNAKVPTPIN